MGESYISSDLTVLLNFKYESDRRRETRQHRKSWFSSVSSKPFCSLDDSLDHGRSSEGNIKSIFARTLKATNSEVTQYVAVALNSYT